MRAMPWPNNLPPDLRRRLESVLGQRSYGPAEIWGEVHDWLVKHGIDAPEGLPYDRPEETAQRD